MPKKRLSEVARELKVEISTIVKFMLSRGLGSQIKPNQNTIIDEGLYKLLVQELHKEKLEEKKKIIPSSKSDVTKINKRNKTQRVKSKRKTHTLKKKKSNDKHSHTLGDYLSEEQLKKLRSEKTSKKLNLDSELNNPIIIPKKTQREPNLEISNFETDYYNALKCGEGIEAAKKELLFKAKKFFKYSSSS